MKTIIMAALILNSVTSLHGITTEDIIRVLRIYRYASFVGMPIMRCILDPNPTPRRAYLSNTAYKLAFGTYMLNICTRHLNDTQKKDLHNFVIVPATCGMVACDAALFGDIFYSNLKRHSNSHNSQNSANAQNNSSHNQN